MRINLVLILTISISGCSSLPTKEDLAKFGDATSKSASSAQSLARSTERLAVLAEEQLQASAYVRGAAFSAGPPRKTEPRIDEAQLKKRVEALRDLQVYGEALAKASDQGAVDALVTAAQKLSGSTAALVSAAVPAASPVAAAVAKPIGTAVGYAFADAYIRQVLTVVRETDETVRILTAQLRDDFSLMPTYINMQVERYRALRTYNLALVREGGASRATLYDQFARARSEIFEVETSANEAQVADRLLDAIYTTHHAIATAQPDIKLTIQRFATLSGEVAGAISALKGEKLK